MKIRLKLAAIEQVLEKIAKFLKYSKEKYQNFKGFKVQLDEIHCFLRIFLNKVRFFIEKSIKFNEKLIKIQ